MSTFVLPVDYISPIAKAYEKLNYRVTTLPEADDLPDFLKQFSPAMIAAKPGDNIVVELRSNVHQKTYSYWMLLEHALRDHSDWHLQLVDPGSLDLDLVTTAEPSDTTTIRQRLHQANQLAETEQSGLAVLIAYGALEASMRAVVASNKIEWDHTNVITLLAALLDAGFIDTDEADFLKKMLNTRNAVAHGFTGYTIESAEICRLVEITNELLGQL